MEDFEMYREIFASSLAGIKTPKSDSEKITDIYKRLVVISEYILKFDKEYRERCENDNKFHKLIKGLTEVFVIDFAKQTEQPVSVVLKAILVQSELEKPPVDMFVVK